MKELDESGARKKAELKLRIKAHDRRDHSVTSYMVCNSFGYVCGGNLMVFIPTNVMKKYDYPTVFRSRDEAQTTLLLSKNRIQEQADYSLQRYVRMV